ncbi:MAG TPA: deaminase [Stackebrandtia sp.]|jgi:pyrimidine deaminase RibD-like protein|uniref:deaminase n=1 Tax=Stackebrandtia sp. TaxID=2023065 RepID=UPI002D675CAA|nr:deaminase [Stackebrandtia sp.]HZE41829.1 deaminase [Stackebrandtia sp.]
MSPDAPAPHDAHWLREAIALAHRCPPSHTAFSVGAVIVSRGRIVASGYSRQHGPHDHAEQVALRQFHDDPTESTIYSSLEPCGQRASAPVTCAELIIAAGIRRVVYAWSEPDTFVEPRGARLLREAGVDLVRLPELAAEAAAPNAHLRSTP